MKSYSVGVRSKFVWIPESRKRALREAVQTVSGVRLRNLDRDDDRTVRVILTIEAGSPRSATTKARRAVERWAKGPGAGWDVEDPAEWR